MTNPAAKVGYVGPPPPQKPYVGSDKYEYEEALWREIWPSDTK